MRCLAYQILLLDEPTPDYAQAFPAFLLSGLPFLSTESIHAIAHARVEPDRLDALRRRLAHYRRQLDVAGHRSRSGEALEDTFTLLGDFTRVHPEFYATRAGGARELDSPRRRPRARRAGGPRTSSASREAGSSDHLAESVREDG